jgi:hypothetical protein
MIDQLILSEAKRPDILEQLSLGKFEAVIQLTDNIHRGKRRFWRSAKKSSGENEIGFAYTIINACLSGKLDPSRYSTLHDLNFQGEFSGELTELFRMLLCLESFQNAPHYEDQVASTLLACIGDGAAFIEKNSNDYPRNSINGKVWMDGAGLRSRADKLSEYFKRKNNDQRELEALFLRAKLTCTIMSHYPETVGPDMNALALKYEKLGNQKEAKKYYTPVVLDFTWRVANVEQSIKEPDGDFFDADLPIVQSLIDALQGLKRIGETVDENLLTRSIETLEHVKIKLGVIKS